MGNTDPFTRTPGVAGKAYIDNGVADEIIRNFRSEESAKYVYKITGLRGSGKSVEYGKIIRTLKEDKNWRVYPLSSSGDAVPDEATLTKMVATANKKKYKVLVGVDDISKTAEMVKLLSMIGSMLLEGLQIYLVVTGLSENIEDFSAEKNLTFFKRADEREIKELSRYDIAYMYEKLLKVEPAEARRIEALTNGYAYAYQVLGTLYFNKDKSETLEDIIPDFERIMFKDSYDLIWRTLTNGEKEVVRCIYRSKDGSAAKIKELMEKPASYSVYRDRLINKHLVDGDERGYLKIRLPRFDKYIEIWGDE